ncbi:hypothetical protein B0H12DRAFT_1239185 [Mycena haematopus]|nr:hypothetical protein B0H12DRAFT_1239185 [Mycena haematopus]
MARKGAGPGELDDDADDDRSASTAFEAGMPLCSTTRASMAVFSLNGTYPGSVRFPRVDSPLDLDAKAKLATQRLTTVASTMYCSFFMNARRCRVAGCGARVGVGPGAEELENNSASPDVWMP